ncbi:MAG: ATP-grasp domain-containing protein [Deltaproteobacteria bacterium]|nr:ATP-grasp domain-containing protein [Deltaproteobacteria bacterium]
MNLKKVAIIYNDDMDMLIEKEHSITSWEGVIDTAKSVEAALKSEGLSTTLIPLRDKVEDFIKTIKLENADIIFNLCEGAMGKSAFEMNVAAVLELFGFRFTGSGPLTLSLALNKARAKGILAYHGIPTPKFTIYDLRFTNLEITNRQSKIENRKSLSFPLIVKPVQEDASIGIDQDAVVKNMSTLKNRVNYVIKSYKQPAIVEEYIDGREFNIAVMGNHKPKALPVSEIDFSRFSENNPKICTYEAKWVTDSPIYLKTPPICPADIPRELEQKLFSIALKAYNVLGCRDYARVDMRMGEDGIPKILEVNPNPDISPNAGFVRSAAAYGFSYPQLILEIVGMTYNRYQKTENRKEETGKRKEDCSFLISNS